MSREVYAQMAATLDSNRKIMKGGRDARDVFLWVLRQIAQRGTFGRIPAADIADTEWLAKVLMCTEDEVKSGIANAVRVGLLRIDDEDCVAVGWTPAHGRRAQTNAERQAAFRDRQSNEPGNDSNETSLLGNESVTPNNDDDENNVGLTEGQKEGQSGLKPDQPPLALDLQSPEPPDPAAILAEACCDELRKIGRRFKAESESTLDLSRKLHRRGVTPDLVRRVVEFKARGWARDPKMAEYLRPATLLAVSNFLAYVDDLDAGNSPDDAPPVANLD